MSFTYSPQGIEIRHSIPGARDITFNTSEWGRPNMSWTNQAHLSFLELNKYRQPRVLENRTSLVCKRHLVAAPTDCFFCGVKWEKHIHMYIKSVVLVPILIDLYLERTIQNQLAYYMKRFYDKHREKTNHRKCLSVIKL